MLRMITLAGLTAFSLATPLLAGSTLEVVVTGNGFFPTITYLRPGDTVVFYNVAPKEINVYAQDNAEAMSQWSTGDIHPGAHRSVVILDETTLVFEMQGTRWVGGNAQGEGEATLTEGSDLDHSTGYWENFTAQGEFTFDPAPLS